MIYTITSRYNCLKMTTGKEPKSRPVWRGAGIEFYVVGPLKGLLYEQAANLAMQKCCELHIPLISLRRVEPMKKEFF